MSNTHEAPPLFTEVQMRDYARAALAAQAPQPEPCGFMSRATYSTSSGAGYKQITFRFTELNDANQIRLWAMSYGAKAANHEVPKWAPQQAQGVPAGWNFNVSHSDGRAWLNITTPAGTQASLSCAHKTGNGDETVAAQVLAYLRDDLLAAAPQAEPVSDADAQELRQWRAMSDPAVLYANLLRGLPAKLTAGQLQHLMGAAEPQPEREPLSREQKRAMWIDATIEACSHENCYLRGIADAEQAHGIGTKGGGK